MNDTTPNIPVFVHRESELKLVSDRLSFLRAGKVVSEPVLFFHGVPMVGKSALLQTIKQRALQNLIPTALIDFSKGYNELSESGRLIREILKQWEFTSGMVALNTILTEDSSEDAAKKLVQFAIQLHRAARPTPLVLLLDTIETINPDTFSWLQKELLEPILDEEKVFIAIAARAEHIELPVELSWPVSRRTRFATLKVFTGEETKDHYKALLKNDSPTSWQKQLISNPNWLTLGVPGLNEIAFQHPFESEQEGVRYMVEQVIFKRIAQDDVAETRDLILTMSAFRKFDYRILAQTANHFWSDRYPEASRRVGVQLARKMKATMLLQMRQDGYGYVISPNIRRLLDDYQRYRKKQQHFEVHCLSYNWFKEEVVRGDFVSVADQIYHLAGAWFDLKHDGDQSLKIPDTIPSDSEDRAKVFSEIINHGLEHISDKSRADTQVDKVLNAFQHERREFSWFLSQGEMALLIESFHTRLDEAVQIADKNDGK